METPTTTETISPKVNKYIECMREMREGIQKAQALRENEKNSIREERVLSAAKGISALGFSAYLLHRGDHTLAPLFILVGMRNLQISRQKDPFSTGEPKFSKSFRKSLASNNQGNPNKAFAVSR